MVALADTDLRLMQVFMTVVDNRGFTGAQVSLNLGASTISMHIAALERRLGVRLCERGRAGFRLTSEGEKVYEISRKLLGSVNAASAELSAMRNILSGRLRIGMVDNIANNAASQVSRAIHQFDKRLHDVSLVIEVVSPRDLERHVSDGIHDIGIGPKVYGLGKLHYAPLFGERQNLYCSDLHPLFAQPDGDPEDHPCANHVCPLPISFRPLKESERLPVMHHMESVAMLVLSGQFTGFLPVHYAQQWVDQNRMRALRPDLFYYVNHFHCMTLRDRQKNRIAARFREDLISCHKDTS